MPGESTTTALDNLGLNRRALVPESDNRGRVFGQHRHDLHSGFQVLAEVGYISDRNFLEEYFEEEWDEEKDLTTNLELKRIIDNGSWSIFASARLYDFVTQTEWLPRLDHFSVGRSFAQDRLTWFEHSHIAFANLKTLDLSTNPADPELPLPWETDSAGAQYDRREGLRAATRQEVDWPFELGPAKIVPYVLGEAAHWGQDRDGDDVTRFYGQAGIRSSLSMWRVNPAVSSPLFNLNGLAHKVVFDTEFFWADANRDLDRFPLYDPLDDDSIEHFRRRFFLPGGPFFGVSPSDALRFDERTYALRSGLQGWVSSPSTEIADDLMAIRLGAQQRWQTKRGLPGQERIIDWVTLDVNGMLFPKPARDNFGQELGLMTYDLRWHVGDRVTVLSDGYMDLFGNGLRTVAVGAFVNRPGRGNYYAGVRSIGGPFSSSVLSGSARYRISPKWIVSYGSAVDLSNTGNIGQVGAITRIGESFLVSLGLNSDRGRDNVGVHFTIEPRFMPGGRLGRVGGIPIPPVGVMGLE